MSFTDFQLIAALVVLTAASLAFGYVAGTSKRRKAVVVFMLIAVVSASLILGFGGYLGSFVQSPSSRGVTVSIQPSIFSPKSNVGILNQNANFTVTITNGGSLNRSAVINVISGSDIVQSTNSSIAAGTSTTQVLTQELSSQGEWKVQVLLGGKVVNTYTFEVYLNYSDGNFHISQDRLANSQDELAKIGALVAGVVAVSGLGVPYLQQRHETHRRRIEPIRKFLPHVRNVLLLVKGGEPSTRSDTAEYPDGLKALIGLKETMEKEAFDISMKSELPEIMTRLEHIFDAVSATNNKTAAFESIKDDVPEALAAIENWLRQHP